MSESLRVLLVEDSENDALLALLELRRSGYELVSERVETAGGMRAALAQHDWDLILSDYVIPGFGGLEALKIAKESGLDLPFILLSNKASEEVLVEAMRAGATDFIMKDRLTRLGPAVRRELLDAAARRGLMLAQIEWQTAFDAVQDPIFIHDADFRIVSANRAYATRAGLPIAELAGKLYWDVFPKLAGPMPACRSLKERAAVVEDRVVVANGETFTSRAFPTMDSSAKHGHFVHVMQDITQREQDEKVLARKERYYRKLIEGGSDVFIQIDRAGTLRYRSESGKQLTGWDTADVLGTQLTDYVPAHSLPLVRNAMAELFAKPGQLLRAEVTMLRRDGTQVETEVLARNLLDDPDVAGIVITAHDISERKHAAQLLKRERDTARRYFSVAGVMMLVLNADGTVALINRRGLEILGCEESDILDQPWIERFVPERARTKVHEIFRQLLSGQVDDPEYFENAVVCRGSEERLIAWHNTVLTDDAGQVVATLSSGEDITERKRSEDALRDSEEKLRTISSTAQDAIVMSDNDGRIEFWNPSAVRLFGHTAEEAIGKPLHELIVPERLRETSKSGFDRFKVTGQGPVIGKTVELPSLRKDGIEFIAEHSISAAKQKGKWHAVALVRDITERKRSEQALHRSNRALRTLSAGNEILIHARDEPKLLQDMCRMMVELGGFRFAWIVYAARDGASEQRIAAHFGITERESEAVIAAWANTEYRPTGDAIRTGQPQIAQDILEDPHFAPWHEYARSLGCAALMAIPLKEGSATLGALAICATEHDAFDAEEVHLLTELGDDLAFGIQALRTRTERDGLQQGQLRSTIRLKNALIGTIGAVALTVEKRDPYTAGHQQRAAELCVAIGRKLALPEDRLEGLRLGATIHDIGKIYVPAEILNRPGKLSAPEFEIIKSHPQVGYDIIKGIQFPWPVAEMILQHHERLDGSGYPRGLKDEQIIVEAKILAVADVVEAMSSHRPYRPELGIDKALAQIRQEAGTKLDAQVVDACERVIREQGFTFGKA
jgi:PAS domain S-box-containing protein